MSHAQDGSEPEVGTLAEEAAKLMGAFNDWAREHGGGLSDGVAEMADHATTAVHDLNAHIGTGAAECSVCPICRTVNAARHLSPEVKNHLASAAASLMHAAAGVMATVVPDADATTPRPDVGGVEHIDLDHTTEEWPDEESV